MYLSGFETISSLELLDLTGRWPLRVGGPHAANIGRKEATRAWARAFVAAWPELDGCLYTSSMTGKECVAPTNLGAADADADAAPADLSTASARRVVGRVSVGASIR